MEHSLHWYQNSYGTVIFLLKTGGFKQGVFRGREACANRSQWQD